MKALSIRQPWAELIVAGLKDIENRTWRTDYRGPVLIHAGMKIEPIDADLREWVKRISGFDLPQADDLLRGGIVGQAEIVDLVQSSSSPWFSGPYGFVLANARRLPFRPMPGQLGIFEVPENQQ
ncbi:MAG: ASCH domain-containing protein [Rhodoplanes sp.]